MKKMYQKFSNKEGFTLVELIVVIAILAILAGAGSVGYSQYIAAANKGADKQLVGNIMRAIDTATNSHAFDFDAGTQVSNQGLQVPTGFVVLSNTPITDAENNPQGYAYIMTPDGTSVNTTFLNDALTAAFGSNYDASMRLKSDKWTTTNIPELYANSSELFSDVKTLSSLLYNLKDTALFEGKLNSENTYNSNTEIVVYAAECIITMSEDEFVEYWKKAGSNTTGGSYAFGLIGSESNDERKFTIEAYAAARKGYNEALATYVENHTDTLHNTKKAENKGSFFSPNYQWADDTVSGQSHANDIRNIGQGLGSLVSPLTACTVLFDNDVNLVDDGAIAYADPRKNTVSDTVQMCTNCKQAIIDYSASPQADADARAFYKTMQTLVAGADSAKKEAEISGDNWSYYNNYVTNFSQMYQDLETITSSLESCIVITVLYDGENFVMNYDVSDDEANPRRN